MDVTSRQSPWRSAPEPLLSGRHGAGPQQLPALQQHFQGRGITACGGRSKMGQTTLNIGYPEHVRFGVG